MKDSEVFHVVHSFIILVAMCILLLKHLSTLFFINSIGERENNNKTTTTTIATTITADDKIIITLIIPTHISYIHKYIQNR